MGRSCKLVFLYSAKLAAFVFLFSCATAGKIEGDQKAVESLAQLPSSPSEAVEINEDGSIVFKNTKETFFLTKSQEKIAGANDLLQKICKKDEHGVWNCDSIFAPLPDCLTVESKWDECPYKLVGATGTAFSVIDQRVSNNAGVDLVSANKLLDKIGLALPVARTGEEVRSSFAVFAKKKAKVTVQNESYLKYVGNMDKGEYSRVKSLYVGYFCAFELKRVGRSASGGATASLASIGIDSDSLRAGINARCDSDILDELVNHTGRNFRGNPEELEKLLKDIVNKIENRGKTFKEEKCASSDSQVWCDHCKKRLASSDLCSAKGWIYGYEIAEGMPVSAATGSKK